MASINGYANILAAYSKSRKEVADATKALQKWPSRQTEINLKVAIRHEAGWRKRYEALLDEYASA